MTDGSDRKVPASRYFLFVAVAACGCAIDLATKSWIFAKLGMPGEGLEPDIWIVRPVFSLTTSLNPGALFGLGQGFAPVFAALSVLAGGFIVFWLFIKRAAADWVLTFTLALIMAGILGNLYDRLGLHRLHWQGETAAIYAVRDWLHFKINGVLDWPIFNVADSLLVCGAFLLFWRIWSTQADADAEKQSAASRQPTQAATVGE